MPNSTRWPDAALVGLASSMRTMAGPAALAARGRLGGRSRVPVLLAAVGELALDKTPAATDRTDLPALGGRVAAGTLTGRSLAGPAGAAAGAVGAGLGSFASWRARGLVVETTGLPDPVVAVGEDLVAIGLAALATRPDPEPPPPERTVAGSTGPAPDPYAPPGGGLAPPSPATAPAETPPTGVTPMPEPTSDGVRSRSVLGDALRGLIAGGIGTAAMTIAQGAEFVLTDAEPSRSPAHVADLIGRRLGLGKVPRKHRRVANQGMHWLYGTSWGVPYGIVAGALDTPPEVTGPAFGMIVWGAALAHQPALGIAEVPWKRAPGSLASEALFHLVYGLGVGAAWRAIGVRGG